MSYNLLELYRNLNDFVKTPQEHALAKLQCPHDYLEKAKSDLHRISTFKSEAVKEIGTSYQDYKWFLSRIMDKQLHPYQIFLNKLISNLTESKDTKKAYHTLLALYRSQNGNDAAIEQFSNQPQTTEWLSQQTLDPNERKLRIDSYLAKINHTFNNVNDPFGLIPLVLHAWGGNPEHLIAFIRWLSKSKTNQEIIDSGLFHELFVLHYSALHDSSGCFSQLYKLMQQSENELTALYNMIHQIRVPAQYISDRVNIVDYKKDHRLTGDYLSTEEVEETSLSQPNQLNFVMSDFHNLEDYIDLLGVEPLVNIILHGNFQNVSMISDLLNKLELEQLANFMEQIGSAVPSHRYLRIPQKSLSMEKISQMIAERYWIVCSFMYPMQLTEFVNHQTSAHREQLINEIKKEKNLDACLLLIAIYRDARTSLKTKEQIYAIILEAVLRTNEIGTLSNFLSEHEDSHKELIQIKASAYHEGLQNLADSLSNSGLTAEIVGEIQDIWSRKLSSFNHFKLLYGVHYKLAFPSNKYTLHQWIIFVEYEIKKENFDLGVVLNMIFHCESLKNLSFNQISELKHLLSQLLCSPKGNELEQHVISVVRELIGHKTLKGPTWQKALGVDDTSFIDLMVEHNNILLYQKLTGKELDETKLNQALTSARNQQKLGVMQEILDRTGQNQPNQETVEATLEWVMNSTPTRNGHYNIILKIIALTGKNKPSQQAVEKVLDWARDKNYPKIVQQILALTGENKPNQTEIVRTLDWAYQQTHPNVIYQIIAMTGENKPNQEVIDNLLKTTAAYGQIEIVQLLLSMTGENKPSQGTIKWVFTDHTTWSKMDIMEKILAMTGDNKLTQADVDSGLSSTFLRAYKADAKRQCILAMKGTNQASQSAVTATLRQARALNQLDLVQNILLMTGENKPDETSVAEHTLHWATSQNHPNIVQNTLLRMERDQFTSKIMSSEDILKWAIGNGHFAVVKQVLSMSGVHKLHPIKVEKCFNNHLKHHPLNEALLHLLINNMLGRAQTPSAEKLKINNMQLNQFKIALADLARTSNKKSAPQDLKRIYKILKKVEVLIDENCDANIVSSYLSYKKPIIENSIKKLQANLDKKTYKNILATLGNFVLFFTVIGTPRACVNWANNLKIRDNCFSFFNDASTATQAINTAKQLSKSTMNPRRNSHH